jgi:hypothetical protein
MGALEIGGGAGNGLAAPPLTRYELGEVRLRDNLSRIFRAIGTAPGGLPPAREAPLWPALAGDTRNEKL